MKVLCISLAFEKRLYNHFYNNFDVMSNNFLEDYITVFCMRLTEIKLKDVASR